jgi:hypothetical protein
MMCKLFVAVAFSAIGFASPGIASPANVTSMNPQSLVVALQDLGYKATLGKDDDGDPLIDTASDGNSIRIVMSDCLNHLSCKTTEFVGLWDCSNTVDKCKQVLADFNNEESPTKALSENDGKTIATYYYLIYDDIGISENLFKMNFEHFSYYNSKFSTMVSQK